MENWEVGNFNDAFKLLKGFEKGSARRVIEKQYIYIYIYIYIYTHIYTIIFRMEGEHPHQDVLLFYRMLATRAEN